jgi:hypothetical protein
MFVLAAGVARWLIRDAVGMPHPHHEYIKLVCAISRDDLADGNRDAIAG